MVKMYGDIEDIERDFNKYFSGFDLYIDEETGFKYFYYNKKIILCYQKTGKLPNVLSFDFGFWELTKYYYDLIRLKLDMNEYIRKYFKLYYPNDDLFLIRYEKINLKRRERKRLKKQYTRKDKLEHIFGKSNLLYGWI